MSKAPSCWAILWLQSHRPLPALRVSHGMPFPIIAEFPPPAEKKCGRGWSLVDVLCPHTQGHGHISDVIDTNSRAWRCPHSGGRATQSRPCGECRRTAQARGCFNNYFTIKRPISFCTGVWGQIQVSQEESALAHNGGLVQLNCSCKGLNAAHGGSGSSRSSM